MQAVSHKAASTLCKELGETDWRLSDLRFVVTLEVSLKCKKQDSPSVCWGQTCGGCTCVCVCTHVHACMCVCGVCSVWSGMYACVWIEDALCGGGMCVHQWSQPSWCCNSLIHFLMLWWYTTIKLFSLIVQKLWFCYRFESLCKCFWSSRLAKGTAVHRWRTAGTQEHVCTMDTSLCACGSRTYMSSCGCV